MKKLRAAIRIIAARASQALLRLARNWLRIVLTALAIYISLPWLAPIFAKAGLPEPADFIYTLYSPFCHQFAFRSPFLFGEQAFYPRAISNSGYISFESVASNSEAFRQQYEYWSRLYGERAPAPAATVDGLAQFSVVQQFAARHFIGDDALGYKTSLCARDLAIYTMLFAGGLIYRRYRWRVRLMPFWLYLVAGLGPVGLDGFSQLLSYPPFEFWPVRETAPLFRIITGGMFGLMSAWLGFPYLERSMQDLVDALDASPRDAGEHR